MCWCFCLFRLPLDTDMIDAACASWMRWYDTRLCFFLSASSGQVACWMTMLSLSQNMLIGPRISTLIIQSLMRSPVLYIYVSYCILRYIYTRPSHRCAWWCFINSHHLICRVIQGACCNFCINEATFRDYIFVLSLELQDGVWFQITVVTAALRSTEAIRIHHGHKNESGKICIGVHEKGSRPSISWSVL